MMKRRHLIGHRAFARVQGALGMTLVLTTLGLVLAVPPAQAAVKIDEFGTPTANSGPVGITTGPDGNLWYTESSADNIGQLTPSKVPVFNYEFPVTEGPGRIVPGSDGNLWFVALDAFGGGNLGKITPTGGVTEFLDSLGYPYSGPAPGPDGNLWVTAAGLGNGFVERITTSGTITGKFQRPLPPPRNHGRPRRQPVDHRLRRQHLPDGHLRHDHRGVPDPGRFLPSGRHRRRP